MSFWRLDCCAQAPRHRSMTTMNRLLSALLVALLVLTSASLAVARTAPDASGKMVLCTGSGPVVIHVDENGDPVGAPHYCPDCAMTLLVALDAPLPAAVQALSVRNVTFDTPAVAICAQPARRAQARGPPLV